MTSAGKYTAAICKGSALLEETRTLLEHWKPGEPADLFAYRVQEEGILGRATAYRARDIVRRVFVPRYLRPTDKPARILKSMIEQGLPFPTVRELALVFIARSDRLIYDFVAMEFWPSVRRGRLFLDLASVRAFLSEAMTDGQIAKPWSDRVQGRVASGLLGLLRDVGFAKDFEKTRAELSHYRMSDEGVLMMARELHESGSRNASLCSHQDWALFGLGEPQVLDRLQLFDEGRGLLLQRAGSVVEINWRVRSIEDLTSLLAGRRLTT